MALPAAISFMSAMACRVIATISSVNVISTRSLDAA